MIVDKKFLKAVALQKSTHLYPLECLQKKNIDDAVKIFRDSDCPFELMHCVSTYPMDQKMPIYLQF